MRFSLQDLVSLSCIENVSDIHNVEILDVDYDDNCIVLSFIVNGVTFRDNYCDLRLAAPVMAISEHGCQCYHLRNELLNFITHVVGDDLKLLKNMYCVDWTCKVVGWNDMRCKIMQIMQQMYFYEDE